MMRRVVTVPDMILIAGTRVALGAGIGLLLSRRLGEGVREGAGWALLAVGALTTIPLVMKLRTATLDEERGRIGPAPGEPSAATAVHSPS
ncbi:hypothetical protein [Anaeromyxobacter terrae]|uniref:hypothetical protein n=1 Tax=Anaeromyxobacter terrae TaxID=2925406 RepID=UPI001F58264A|nr:hypothetical protein [Anaeromyxobacter sp. SG22]